MKTTMAMAMAMRGACALACALLLAGCADGDVREVREWMEQVRRDTRPRVKPLPEPKEFIAYAYGAKDATDPFSPNKLQVELAGTAPDNTNAPDTGRPRDLLETFPLDTMRMVGTLEKGGVAYALLQIDRSVYQVRTGQRIGQNFGVVTRVGEDAVTIREVVQDAAGAWVERMARLELQNKETGK
jgi:type IV pilus assembly protein PilP